MLAYTPLAAGEKQLIEEARDWKKKKGGGEKRGFKTLQKEKGGDPIFLKIESKSLAEAKLTSGKKPHPRS